MCSRWPSILLMVAAARSRWGLHTGAGSAASAAMYSRKVGFARATPSFFPLQLLLLYCRQESVCHVARGAHISGRGAARSTRTALMHLPMTPTSSLSISTCAKFLWTTSWPSRRLAGMHTSTTSPNDSNRSRSSSAVMPSGRLEMNRRILALHRKVSSAHHDSALRARKTNLHSGMPGIPMSCR